MPYRQTCRYSDLNTPRQKARAIGNVLRHEYHSLYHSLSDRIVWSVVIGERPRLREAIVAILA